ncbi:MAG: NUDIX domain-containing protein [Bacteroidales bacterium]
MVYTYDYPRPAVAVDCIVFLKEENSIKLLLVERERPPYRGQWAFPGGFVESNETLEQAASRELKEETGLKDILLQQMYTFSAPDRDPRDRIITTAYVGTTDNKNYKLTAGDDAANAQWFPLENHPKLAFDHEEILTMAVEKLKMLK